MAVTPTQQTSINSFADHRFTNTINRFTRIVSGGADVILPFDNNVLSVTIDVTTQGVDISPGMVIKDDVLIHLPESTNLDFTNSDNYVGTTGLGPAGDYFVLLKYIYYQSVPPPSAYYVVCRQRAEFLNNRTKYMYLATATVVQDGLDFIVDSISTTDTDELNGGALIERPMYTFKPHVIDGGLYVP